MEKNPLILKKCQEADGDRLTFEKYLGFHKTKNPIDKLYSEVRNSTKNNMKSFLSYLIQ